ncbi:hypothetical protein TcasGA2_TC005382 [Tribolium castaneum]|uniref:BAG domain-containing protein n=1 Tax=Tribolium castaneum TaxID=7070 RepID=D6WUP9_TRICA|nr:hypothetical protein TcasGA2_TC005382 [Tribolium castaneum]
MASCGKSADTEQVMALDDDSDDEAKAEEDSLTKKVMEYEESTLKEISNLTDEVEKTSDKIDEITDSSLFENYAEYLLQVIIKLDNIDPKNNRKIREARKDAIVFAQGTLQKLDKKMSQ